MSTNKKSNIDFDSLKIAKEKKFAIVHSEWNIELVNRLLNGAFEFFSAIGLEKDKITICSVPGSFELIYGCKKMSQKKKYDAIIFRNAHTLFQDSIKNKYKEKINYKKNKPR